jgi:hypothetical protein
MHFKIYYVFTHIQLGIISLLFAWLMFYKLIHYDFSYDDHLMKDDVVAVLTGEES